LKICWLYQSTDQDGARERHPHFPSGIAAKLIQSAFNSPLIPAWIFSHLNLTEAHAQPNAPVSKNMDKWPLLMMSHGILGIPEVYTILSEALASQGFIICAPVHTDGSPCTDLSRYHKDEKIQTEEDYRNRQLLIRAANISSALNHLLKSDIAQYVDSKHIGICGHSFGGATAIQVLSQDPRIMCGVSWDGWMFPLSDTLKKTPIQKPFLFINSDLWQWKENLEVMKNLSQDKYMIAIKSTRHHNFDDSDYFSLPYILQTMKMIGFNDRQVVKHLITILTVAFFVKHLHLENNLYKEHIFDDTVAKNSTNLIIEMSTPQ